MKNIPIEEYDEVLLSIQEICDKYYQMFSQYISVFESYGIEFILKPCYFYNGKFHSKIRQKGCSVHFRVMLFPKEKTYKQGEKEFYAKKFFSKRLAFFEKTSNKYVCIFDSSEDAIMKRFLEKLVGRCQKLKYREMATLGAIKESIGDVFRSWFLLHRYCSEVKTTYRGHSLLWIIIVIILILVWLSVDAKHDLISTTGL